MKTESTVRIVENTGGHFFFDFAKDNISPHRYEAWPIPTPARVSGEVPADRQGRVFPENIFWPQAIFPEESAKKRYACTLDGGIRVLEYDGGDIAGLTESEDPCLPQSSFFRRIPSLCQNVFFETVTRKWATYGLWLNVQRHRQCVESFGCARQSRSCC